MKSNRRNFLKTGARASILGISGISAFANVSSGSKSSKGMFSEAKREIPVVRETDVIVCGGGPAGVAAAINAARTGARTTLIELYGCLGGVWTAGLLSNIIDYQNKPGIMAELVNRIEKSDAQYSAKVYDAELMKYTLDSMCMEAGIDVRLHTRVSAAYTNKNNKLEYILTESNSGREAWNAQVFIDCTGNGDLAAQAGCGFDYGHPETGKTQPMSLMAIIVGLDEKAMVAEGLMAAKGGTAEDSKRRLHEEIMRGGIDASYTMPTMFGIRPGMIALMANHQYGVSALDANKISIATIEARKELNQIIDGLRSLGGVWSKCPPCSYRFPNWNPRRQAY